MEWTGDALQLQRSLLWAAGRLEELEKAGSAALRQRSRLCAAASASAAGLLVLILLPTDYTSARNYCACR